MSTNAKSGCGRGEKKYVKEIHFLHSKLMVYHNSRTSNIILCNAGVNIKKLKDQSGFLCCSKLSEYCAP